MTKGYKGFQKGKLNPSANPKRRKEISEWRKKQTVPLKQRQKISRSMKRALKNPELLEKWRKNGIGRKISEEAKKKISMKNSQRPRSLSAWIHKLDTVYAKYRKLSEIKNDCLRCFTCTKVIPIELADLGHFVGRQYKPVRWDDRNTQIQCRWCNRFNEGMKDEFALALQKKYGDKIVEELVQAKWMPLKLDSLVLQEMIKDYQQKTKEL